MTQKHDTQGEPLPEKIEPSAPAQEDAASRAATETPGAAPTPELPHDLPAAYQKVLAEKQELYDRLLRQQAEWENYRKRVQREREDYLQHATSDLLRALLPVLDGFDRALRHRDPNVPKAFYEGMELIHQEMLGVMNRAGVTPIETTGKIFDPHLHQAVETVEAEGHRDQEIVEELQRGYKFKHRLLRPAVVKVAATTIKKLTEEDG